MHTFIFANRALSVFIIMLASCFAFYTSALKPDMTANKLTFVAFALSPGMVTNLAAYITYAILEAMLCLFGTDITFSLGAMVCMRTGSYFTSDSQT